MSDISRNTQAILLLTAPLIADGKRRETPYLTPGEYRNLAVRLHGVGDELLSLFEGAAPEQATGPAQPDLFNG